MNEMRETNFQVWNKWAMIWRVGNIVNSHIFVCWRSIILQKIIDELRAQISGYQRKRERGKVNWMKAVKRYKLPVIRYLSTRHVIYNMKNIVSIVLCYIWRLIFKILIKGKFYFYLFKFISKWVDGYLLNPL